MPRFVHILILFLGLPLGLCAQATDSLRHHDAPQADSLRIAQTKMELARARAELGVDFEVPDSITKEVGEPDTKKWVPPTFIPNPNKALWLALVCPGAGQIYNRKYWKLPIVYGGFMGCAYALMWNQMMYRDYSQAYLDIMDDDPNTASYKTMLPPRYSIEGREEQFKNIFKNKKNFYRRNRDLSAFCFVGVYLLSVIDAYVDAHLSDFDITPDLSLRVEPAVISEPTPSQRQQGAYGVGVGLRF